MDIFGTTVTALGLVVEVKDCVQAVRGAAEDRTKLLVFLRAIETSLLTITESKSFLPDETYQSRVMLLNGPHGALTILNSYLTQIRDKINPVHLKPEELHPGKDMNKSKAPQGVLANLNKCLIKHRKISPAKSITEKPSNISKARISSVLDDLKWPYTKNGIDNMVAELLRFHQALLGTQSQILQDMTDQKLQKLEDIEFEKWKRRRIENNLDWLSEDLSEIEPEREKSMEVRPTWFWAEECFRLWEANAMNSGTGNLLWCPGGVGVGKTVFSACLIEALRAKYGHQNFAILRFYFRHHQGQLHTTDKIMGYLCRQILAQKNHLYSIVDSHREEKEEHKIEDKDLPGLLRKLLDKLDGSFIILDAFDECHTDNAVRILKKITELLTYPTLRILITGRHGCDRYFESYPYMEFLALKSDLKAYIQKRFVDIFESGFLRLDQGTEEDQGQLVEHVVEQCGGSFLIARCHMNELEESSTFNALRLKVGKLPKELNKVYDANMDRVKACELGNFEQLGMKVLMWVVHAKRQLRVEELLEAYIASRSQEDLDDEESKRLSAGHLEASTIGLIDIHPETRNVSIHKSLQEYFVQGGKKESHFKDADYEISSVCMKYLRFKRFSTGHCTNQREWDERVSNNVFLEYSTLNWGRHVLDLKEGRILKEILALLSDDGCCASAAQALVRFPDPCGPRGWLLPGQNLEVFPEEEVNALLKPLHLAAYFNLQQTSKELISRNEVVNERSTCGRTPLNIACSLGYVDIVQLLLNHKADPNVKDLQGHNCLQAASAAGQERVVAILLKPKTSPPIRKDPQASRALLAAAFQGSVETVTTLLAEDIPLGARLTNGRNVMHLATQGGHPSIIKLIYEKDSAVAAQLLKQGAGDFGDQPIHSAAYGGRPELIEILWILGADLEARQNTMGTPLHIACQHGRPGAALKLLRLGAAPDTLEKSDKTPLHLAAQLGHKGVIKILVEFTTGISGYFKLRCKPMGETALHLAAKTLFGFKANYHPFEPVPESLRNHTYFECFQSLHEADKSTITIANDAGETPMHLAATAGNLQIVNFILEQLSFKDANDVLKQITLDTKKAPLHGAVAGGHVDVVQRLLDAGAPTNQEDADGKTAVQLAEAKGDEIFKLVSSYSRENIPRTGTDRSSIIKRH